MSGRKNRAAAMKAARKLATHDDLEWEFLCDFCGGRCVRCHRQFILVKQSGEYQRPEVGVHPAEWECMTKDHVQPISGGGSDGIENIQPLCLACNINKHAGTAHDWRPQGWQEGLTAAKANGWRYRAGRIWYCVGCPPDCTEACYEDWGCRPWLGEAHP